MSRRPRCHKSIFVPSQFVRLAYADATVGARAARQR